MVSGLSTGGRAGTSRTDSQQGQCMPPQTKPVSRRAAITEKFKCYSIAFFTNKKIKMSCKVDKRALFLLLLFLLLVTSLLYWALGALCKENNDNIGRQYDLKTFFLVYTVFIGFCDQPPSRGSRSLNPMEVAKSSGFPLGIATRWSLKDFLLSTGYNDLDGRYFTM